MIKPVAREVGGMAIEVESCLAESPVQKVAVSNGSPARYEIVSGQMPAQLHPPIVVGEQALSYAVATFTAGGLSEVPQGHAEG
jgi:hypothetical protein